MIRLTVVAAGLALALTAAPPAAADNRLVEVRYDAAKVYRIEGKPKVQATIRFGEDESIENVAVGDSNAWQITPNKRANLLFVKPLLARASTNMTVVTNKHTYLFDLVASPGASPMYVLSFTYPDAKPKPGAQMAAAAEPEKPAIDPAIINFAWTRSGDKKLLPESVFDDGEATFLTWPEGRAVPAILITDTAGTEGPVNFTVRGSTIVVEGVPSQIVLRAGKDRALIVNSGPTRPARAGNTNAITAPPALAQQDRR
ncbi:TrbG/VirB9 family P-type conjugative transfer protein [Qipengyuania sediminis]|uniref:TrbG/VirB9 family P-type conjugative transfer protein n=1 Tax=Qipengyuania sediminis TaxID=1532023 RepID=UPI0010595CED|nr:TrbG/VirB9 family P-type conjugative transfer protein [Qipengyuania sediminis]